MRRLPQYVIVFVLLTFGAFSASGQDRYEYINKFERIAMAEMQRAGIPASIKIAQGILESNAGASMLAERANNHFGIKCGGNWRGRSMYKQDDDRNANGKLVKSCFRWFDSPEESYIAHSDFLKDPSKSARYGFLFELDPTDYRGWAYGLKRAGYATNPNYPKLLIRIIEEYSLAELDRRAMKGLADVPSEDPTGPIAREIVANIRAYPAEYHNDVKAVVAYEGDTPASLAARLDVPVRKILKYNATVNAPSDSFEEGQHVYLKPKKGAFRGDQLYHLVKAGETMADVSDRYGVKLKKLYKRNGMIEGSEPAAGQRIILSGKNDRDVKTQDPEAELPEILPEKKEAKIDKIPSQAVDLPKSQSESGPGEVVDKPVYVVQKSDTLYQIARLHGLTVAQLKKMNNLTGDLIHPGQTLKLQE